MNARTARRILWRIVAGLATILLATTIVFVLARSTGDPARQILGIDATAEQVAATRAELGLDQPLITQYGRFLGELVTGDLGESYSYGSSNLTLIMSRLGNSLALTAVAVVGGSILGYLLALVGALRRGTIWDRASTAIAAFAQSVPPFWLGLMLISVLSLQFGLLPAGGSGSIRHIILPALSIGVIPLAQVTRVGRTAIVGVLAEDYVLAARSRGFGTARVITRHVMRASAIPVVTVIGLLTGAILSSAVTVEIVFGWPGIGSLVNQAVSARDFSLLQALVIVGALVFVIVNLLVDLLYEVLDPRTRVS